MNIDRFEGNYRFLSNFYIEPDGSHVEGEYQAQKCADPADMVQFLHIHPGACKRLGRRVKLRSDWESVKVETMRALVWQKFVDHLVLQTKLLATGDAELIEGNHWHDSFWGVCNGWGRNELGKILMQVRTKLIQCSKPSTSPATR